MKRILLLLAGLMLLASACVPAAPDRPVEPPTQEPAAKATEVPTALPPIPTLEPEATAIPAASLTPALSFEKATYEDAANGFALDYPAGWALDDGEQHSRGGYVQLYSWDWQQGEPVDFIPSGETVLTVTVNLWDPKHDLAAFVAQRKLGWENSGFSVLEEQKILLGEEHPAKRYILQGPDGMQSIFLFTTVDENYLTLSGSGDLALLSEVISTLRVDQ